jgi:ribosomal protein L37AE/L43A
MYTSYHGVIKINKYPTAEFRIWICVKCTNDFQTLTTKPFMIDMQCGLTSTSITIPDEMMNAIYNKKI